MIDASPESLSRAFSTASGKFYAVDMRKAASEAASFFLSVLRQMQTDEA